MGMFDWYQPALPIACPACGHALSEWQGKDGPCDLFVWVEGKPSPEPYLKGAVRLGVPAAECLVFEDTPAGIASAKAAGMRVIGLCTTYPATQLAAADAIVGTLADVRAQVSEGSIMVTIEENGRSNG